MIFNKVFQDFESYQEWKKNRNKERSILEEKHGFDPKHCMHLVRLFRQCKDILINCDFCVRRNDAEELIQIRNGSMKYEEILELAEREHAELDELVKITKLPKSPDLKKIDELCVSIVEEFINKGLK